jgi:NTP pyrophosphatase (non-canonical NTP hydrolase)
MRRDRRCEFVISLRQYQTRANVYDRIDWTTRWKRAVALMGALGEFGSVISEVKKNRRDEESYAGFEQRLAEELGDLLWYVAAIATFQGISLDELEEVKPKPGDDGWFTLAEALAKLAQLMNKETKTDNRELKSHVAVAIAHIQSTAKELDVSFADIMQNNLDKAESRWAEHRDPAAPWPDRDAPAHEHLPRNVEIDFHEVARGNGGAIVYMRCRGITIGDRLTDNSYEDDSYRFHDAFHLANAATLGWSPVTRSLFNCKRKSNPKTDEVEDGARAQIVEEAISFLIFNHAQQYRLLENATTIDQDLIRQVRSLVSGLEASERTIWEWEHAILSGYRVFRALREEPRGGRVKISADTRAIEYLGPVDESFAPEEATPDS